MIKNQSKWMICLWLVCLISLTAYPMIASADVPYTTFTKDSYNRIIRTQPAYAPTGVAASDIYIDNGEGEKVFSPLKSPHDLFIDHNDHIYIADTGNNRIVHLNAESEFVREIKLPESPFNNPQGVFVTDNGDIYVADTGNKRVVKLDTTGKLQQEFKRPDAKLADVSLVYEPTNIVVDRRGFLYVVSTGSYQGIVELEPSGDFYGFYGTNATEVTLMDRIRRQFYTKEQLSRQVRLLPTTIRNIDIDDQGFVYTVSGSSKEQVKKLNIRGENVWKDKSFSVGFYSGDDDKSKEQQLSDLSVDRDGNITLIDKNRNYVSQYDASGNLQFFWTAPPSSGTATLGINRSPVAIATNSKKELFILDDSLNLVQVLKPTEFGSAIHQAYSLTQQGKYQESEQYWNKVVKLNAFFSPAYNGMAQAAYNREDYERARELYKLSGNAQGYSDSFWQLRLQWFQQNFSHFANLAVGLLIAYLIVSIIKSRYKLKLIPKLKWKWLQQSLITQLKHSFTILKHPIDGFSDLRFLNKGGYLSAFILLAGTVLMLLLKTYYTGFSFNPVPVADMSGSYIIIGFLVTWLSWVVCNYLIGSIYQGEARFKDVIVGGAYALFPVILLGIPLALISNVLSLNEASIYHAVELVMLIWCGLMFFWKIQSLQNYSVGETIVNILLTLFAMIIMWVLIFLVFGLVSQFVNFIRTIIQEVSM
ncbi:tetratricopeptide (TPR) repeat protein [Paenibacillus castaneae]|uniref:YIP1 family protein n=1 Tax=Paenibacillus castaneae TaxID=474957 RepID=UPI000C9C2072|nr:YIP1 family protein [Paenibacillus castaneae]NIK75351.1 tetratricopeptide (TPR) repeat protein [Paenibacillus castaneae]